MDGDKEGDTRTAAEVVPISPTWPGEPGTRRGPGNFPSPLTLLWRATLHAGSFANTNPLRPSGHHLRVKAAVLFRRWLPSWCRRSWSRWPRMIPLVRRWRCRNRRRSHDSRWDLFRLLAQKSRGKYLPSNRSRHEWRSFVRHAGEQLQDSLANLQAIHLAGQQSITWLHCHRVTSFK